MEPLRHKSVVRFGTYEVSFQSGELRKAGLRIRVQQQPMKLLEILLERPGEVVTREELRNRVWPNESFGDFDQALNIAIGKLRNALGDSAENPRCIETLPKRGYRFIADVSVVDADVHPKQPESAARDLPRTESGHPLPDAELSAAPKGWVWPPRRVLIALVLVLSLSILSVLVISFAWSCANGHPIPGGASAGQPLGRRFTGVFRRWHDRRADHGPGTD